MTDIKKYIGVETNLFGYNGDTGTIDRFYPSYGINGQFRIVYTHDKYISWVNKDTLIETLKQQENLLFDIDKLINDADTSHLSLYTSDSHELMFSEGFKMGFNKAIELLKQQE
jgi:hypothetical protein